MGRKQKMFVNKTLVARNAKGQRLQPGLIYGSNPNRATSWCDQPTAPPLNTTYKPLTGNNGRRFVNYNFGFWGEANAIKYFGNSSQMGCNNS